MTHPGYPAHKDTKKFLEIVTATTLWSTHRAVGIRLLFWVLICKQTTQNKQEASALQLPTVLAFGLLYGTISSSGMPTEYLGTIYALT